MSKILVVEDDANLLETLKYNLRKEGYDVLTATDGAEAIDTAVREKPDLVILDVMLPVIDGFEVCSVLRRNMTVPILMLTAKAEEVDKVVGLEIGADDYMTKPFSLRELIARVRAMLRRVRMIEPSPPEHPVINIGPMEIDTARHVVTLDGTSLEFTPKEYDLLVFLARNKGLVFSREQLLEKVWGYDYAGETRTVDVHVRWLRQKIESNPSQPLHLVTVRGAGYKLGRLRMFRSLQWRITIPFILIIIIGMSVLGIFLVSHVQTTRLENLREHLGKETRLVAEASIPSFLTRDGSADILAKKLGSDIQARITLIAPDGKVLGDSEENPAGMENHGNRPEVISALASGHGESTRFSITLNKQMLYVALPAVYQGKTVGVARVALPLTTVRQTVDRITLTVTLAIILTAAFAVIAAWLIARLVTKPVREVTEAARRISAGEFGKTIFMHTGDEAEALARAFNEMSINIKNLVEDISAEKTRLATVLGNMTDGVIMTDAGGKIVLANRAAGAIFNFAEDKAAGKYLIEAVHDHEVDEALKRCYKTGVVQAAQMESGIARHFLRVIAIPIAGDRAGGCLLLIQDLTELRNLQTMRRELIGNLSHDLRNPIAGIKAMVETLKEGAIDDRKAALDFLVRIESEIDRLAQLVAEITELSRIETGDVKIKKEPVDLNILVEEVVNQMSPLAQRQQVSLDMQLVPSLPPVPADRERIRQALVNLTHNAIKFNRRGGKVTITTMADSNCVTVNVIDTGIGIAHDDLPHIFERFYKADRSRTGQGSGLGLAIAKHTIQAHNGRIWAQSEIGKGSTFSFSLPFHNEH
ncbi:MAG: response regulator [Dehalococcoidia bacterium]|nr:response regulator [Dehalococcoidia bacterium]